MSVLLCRTWLVRRDVEAGRDEFNFSEWNRGQEADHAVVAVADAPMPSDRYVLLHTDARLPDAEGRQLIHALNAMERDEDDGSECRDGDGGRRGRENDDDR